MKFEKSNQHNMIMIELSTIFVRCGLIQTKRGSYATSFKTSMCCAWKTMRHVQLSKTKRAVTKIKQNNHRVLIRDTGNFAERQFAENNFRQIDLHVRQIGFRQIVFRRIVFRQIVPYPVLAPAKCLK